MIEAELILYEVGRYETFVSRFHVLPTRLFHRCQAIELYVILPTDPDISLWPGNIFSSYKRQFRRYLCSKKRFNLT